MGMWWAIVGALLGLARLSIAGSADQRIALVITLVGGKKLSSYFEWSCRSIGASKNLVDMLVFHENNKKLAEMQCAENVKLINLGDGGMSELIAKSVIPEGEKFKDSLSELRLMMSTILTHMPRYLVEVKPMIGSLFSSHLAGYSHWSYSDPDIVWGNLEEWVDKTDLQTYDFVSIAKNWDAGRLYLRGQMTWHRNTDKVNSLWKELKYLSQTEYVMRMGAVYRLLLERAPTGSVFRKNCHSAEGWYSQLVFRHSNLSVKIVGRAFDDYFGEPLVLLNGRLHRCQLKENVTACHQTLVAANATTSARDLPAPIYESVQTFKDETQCKMHWLPPDARYCIATPVYDKGVALVQDKQSDIKLTRVGEVILVGGEWKANNEMAASRQLHDVGAFFHFRHWDDFIAIEQATTWPADSETCMVLYLRSDQAMAYEPCSILIGKEAMGENVLLTKAKRLVDEVAESTVAEALAHYRKKGEVGAKRRPRKEPVDVRGLHLTKSEKMEELRKAKVAAHLSNVEHRKQKSALRGHPSNDKSGVDVKSAGEERRKGKGTKV